MIGLLHDDTLSNLSDCLTLLGDLALYEETHLTDRACHGFYWLMKCVNHALRFEMDYREDVETQASLEKVQAHQVNE